MSVYQETFNAETLGSFVEVFEGIRTQVSMRISPSDLGGFWNRCGLTANFGAAFIAYNHPDQQNTRNTLSFILNELVENGVKFSTGRDKQLTINMMETDDKIIFEVTNFVTYENYKKFREYSQYILDGENISEKYLEVLQEQKDAGASGRLGLLTISDNFNARLGVKMESTENPGVFKVTVQVIINPLEI
jgi:hypothetical protein